MENQQNALPEENENQQKEKKHSSVASINSIITGATGAVHSRHSHESWGNTGTNISYEGTTAPGSGGSVGTGQASGSDATGASINTAGENDFVVPSGHTKKETDQQETGSNLFNHENEDKPNLDGVA